MDDSSLPSFLKILFNPQTYLNILYLLISFPLGILYFVMLTIGFSLGLGLAFILVGIPLLLAMFGLIWLAGRFERNLANLLLRTDLPDVISEPPGIKGGVARILRTTIFSAPNWRTMAYLAVKFPFGIISFVLTITMIAVSGALVSAPLTYRFNNTIGDSGIVVNSLPMALLVMVVGLVIGVVSLWIINRVTDVWRAFTVRMLSGVKFANTQQRKLVHIPYDGEKPKHQPTYDEEEDVPSILTEKPKRSISDLIQDLMDEDNEQYYNR